MACHLFDKPLSEPMLVYCYLDLCELKSVIFEFWLFSQKKIEDVTNKMAAILFQLLCVNDAMVNSQDPEERDCYSKNIIFKFILLWITRKLPLNMHPDMLVTIIMILSMKTQYWIR